MKIEDNVTNDLKCQPRQLQKKKLIVEQKQRNIESKQSFYGQQAKRISERLRGSGA